MIAPTIAAAVAYELAADRHKLTATERYEVAEAAAALAAAAGHPLVTTGDVSMAVNRLLDGPRREA